MAAACDLTKCKLDVKFKDDSGYTLLHKVVMKDSSKQVNRVEEKDVNILKLLLKFNPDINIINALTSEGENILHLAIINERSLEMVRIITKALLDNGVDINLVDKKGNTAFYYALSPISFNKQNYYSSNYSNFNFKFTDAAIVQHLIEKGSRIDMDIKNGFTPLLLAVIMQKTDYVRVLLEHKDKTLEKTVSTFVCQMRCHSYNTLVQYPPEEYYGMTPLMVAVYDNNKDMAQILISTGADVNAVRKGQNSLHMIIKRNSSQKQATEEESQIAKLLIDSGIDINAKLQGEDPLHLALTYNKQDIVTSMLEKGLDTL